MASDFAKTLEKDVNKIATDQWKTTDGKVVPETDGIGLGNVGVELDATMLYADLADSTELAMNSRQIAAEVYEAFLLVCSRIITRLNGEVRSFDGDRVMGVFIGGSKNTNAVKTALHINWAFTKIIVPAFSVYEVFRNKELSLKHAVGVDTSRILVARAGMREHNDLVWVGRAPNIAAKLSTLRESGFSSYITSTVYNNMNSDAKVTNGRPMWESRTWPRGPEECKSIYRSGWHWSL